MLADIFGADLLIVVIVAAAVVLLGASAIPKLARNLGSAKREFGTGLKHDAATRDRPPKDGETNNRASNI